MRHSTSARQHPSSARHPTSGPQSSSAVALLLAAGRGERLGAKTPKAFVELAGKPLVQWSLDVLGGCEAVHRIVLALPPGHTGLPQGVQLPSNAVCVPGGGVRSESVRLALRAAGAGDPVLVHDSARPLLTPELVERTLRAIAHEGVAAAIAAATVTDTIKRTDPAGEASTPLGASAGAHEDHAAGGEDALPLPIVAETLDRAGLWAVQTPQVFRRAALERALDVPDEVLAQATDDAWLIERAGGRVAIVRSPPENLKVTRQLDLLIAEMLLARGSRPG